MKNTKHGNFQRFASAFFNTATEKHLRFNQTQQRDVLLSLAKMPHWWHNTDQFQQIRHGEELAVKLSRKQGGSNHDG